MITPTKEPPALFRHQQELFDRTRDEIAWAYFLEQGLGKSAPAIRTIEHLYRTNKIDAVIVVAPNGVHRNWVSDELPKHAGMPYRALDWHSDRGKGQDKALERLLSETPGSAHGADVPLDHLRRDVDAASPGGPPRLRDG